jgi:hypothetical protein
MPALADRPKARRALKPAPKTASKPTRKRRTARELDADVAAIREMIRRAATDTSPPRTPLAKKVAKLRAKMEAAGEKFLTADEILKEMRRERSPSAWGDL